MTDVRPLSWLVDMAEAELLAKLAEGVSIRLCPREMDEESHDLFIGTRKAFMVESMAMDRLLAEGLATFTEDDRCTIHYSLTNYAHMQLNAGKL